MRVLRGRHPDEEPTGGEDAEVVPETGLEDAHGELLAGGAGDDGPQRPGVLGGEGDLDERAAVGCLDGAQRDDLVDDQRRRPAAQLRVGGARPG